MMSFVPYEPIFVFGSNLAGRHGKGDALIARQRHGAVYGQGEGWQGASYAIPTKGENIRTLPLLDILPGVRRFIDFALKHPELNFEIQALGCRLAGYEPWQIAPMFSGAPANCFFHPAFREVLVARGEFVRPLPAPRAGQAQGTLAF